jgi:hypothetical protein
MYLTPKRVVIVIPEVLVIVVFLILDPGHESRIQKRSVFWNFDLGLLCRAVALAEDVEDDLVQSCQGPHVRPLVVRLHLVLFLEKKSIIK